MRLFGIPITPRQLHFAAGDLLVVVLAVLAARAFLPVEAGTSETFGLLLHVGVTLAALYVTDAYDARLDFREPRQILRLWVAVSFATLVRVVALGWSSLDPAERVAAALAGAALGGLLPAWRGVLCHVGPRPRLRRTLVLGAGPAGRAFAEAVRAGHDGFHEVVGFLDEHAPSPLGGLEDLSSIVEAHDVEVVVVALIEPPGPELTRQLLACKARGIQVEEMPTAYKLATGKVPIAHLPATWLLFGPQFAGTHPLAAGAQQLTDLVLACIGLVLTAPVIAVAALAVRLESPGPAFYVQERLGKGERPFPIYKLRTMRQDAEAGTGAVWSQGSADPRVTRVGRWLRRTRIDELPQLFNVLRGEMSIVGPRPERAHFVERLKERIPYYAMRFAVKPGVTGWAQVEYRYGASEEDAAEKLCYELYAIQEMGPLLYGLILLKTVQTVLLRPGS